MQLAVEVEQEVSEVTDHLHVFQLIQVHNIKEELVEQDQVHGQVIAQ